jgi:hypothetical protein
MADTNSNHAPAQSIAGTDAPSTGAEVQEFVLPPWEDGSDPAAPTVDHEDNHVHLDAYGFSHPPGTLRVPIMARASLILLSAD